MGCGPRKVVRAGGFAVSFGLAAVVFGLLQLVVSSGAMAQSAALVAELRQGFTLGGKVVPPEIFRDMGDGDLADSKSILTTVDLDAAVGSNRYADGIRDVAGWQVQKSEQGEEEAYRFVGVASNGLLVVVTRFSGGGSGRFFNLHVLDLVAARSLDPGGKAYDRLDLTTIQTVPLGDRWDGDVRISGDVIAVTASGGALAGSQTGRLEIVVRRP
jgi:hypothetical protein